MGEHQRSVCVHHQRVIAQAGKVQHHLIHLGIAVATHGCNAVGVSVQQLRHLSRCVAFGQGIARPVVQQVAKQQQSVGAFFVKASRKRFGCR